MKLKSLFILLLVSSFSFAGETKFGPITGNYLFGPETQYDAHPQEPNTHFRFEITGASAKSLYDSIFTKPVKEKGCVFKNDGCFEFDVKKVNEVRCQFDYSNKSYLCSFAINLKTEKIVKSTPLSKGDI